MLAAKIQEFRDRRASNPALPQGSAPSTASAFFKATDSTSAGKACAKPWLHHLSTECAAWGFSALKTAAQVTKAAPTISLGTARPAPEYYPYDSLTIDAVAVDPGGDDGIKQVSVNCSRGEDGYDLAVAFNYGFPTGSPQLVRFVTEHVELVHDPPYSDWECSLTCGSTSAQDIALRMFCDRGDWIIVEEYTYSGTKDGLRGHGLQSLAIAMDEQGLRANDLDDQLSNWDPGRGRKPHVMYMIPSGHNPTGTTQSAERRRQIYSVAEKHDLFILEDDPYYFISLFADGSNSVPASTHDYLSNLPPSYLSLDTSGRVLRMDGASKLLAPGLRCSWLTASAPIVARFKAYSELSIVAPSGPSQVLMYKLLDETWGHDGFVAWLLHLSKQYSHRLRVFLDACELHLPLDVCRWATPTTGMFVWIVLDMAKHASASPQIELSVQEKAQAYSAVEDRIYTKAREAGVLVSKGSWFATTTDKEPEVKLRLTFAAAPPGQLVEAVKRLGKVVVQEFQQGH